MQKKRVKTPTLIQMEATECGAAALGIILGYFGKYVPLAELRMKCGVNRDGSKVINILQAAEYYDLEAEVFKKSVEELKELAFPLIVFWEFNHFVVVEGFSKKKVYLNDPATGPFTVSTKEFIRKYAEIVLTFKPSSDFKKSGEPKKLWATLQARLWPAKKPLLFIFLCGLALVFPGWAGPALQQVFFDSVLLAQFFDWAFLICSLLFILSLFAGGITWLQLNYLNRLNAALAVQFSSDFIWHILRLPLSFYMQRFGGEVAYRSRLNETVSRTLTGNLAPTLVSFALILFYAFFMLNYDVIIAAFGIAGAGINVLVLWLMNRSRTDAYIRKQQEMGKSVGFAIGTLQNIEICKAAGTEMEIFSRWAGYYAKKINAEREINTKDAFLGVIPSFLTSLSTTALLGIGAYRILEGDLSVGMLVALQGLLFNFLGPVSQTVYLGSSLQLMRVDVDRLDDVLKNQIDINLQSEESDSNTFSKLKGDLVLKDVSFGYSPLEPPLIQNLNLEIKSGNRVALVGPTGCGKSTVANLVSGLYPVTSGAILYDGQTRGHIPRRKITNSIAVVDQRIYLFAGTIRENITLWDETISDEDLFQAAKDACIHEEILEREGGYMGFVLEAGSNFSGGQRQKLEIARALALNPTLLIMDEATSALDSKTEKEISDNIRRRGCSCLMIAHRLSTIRDADEILVLEYGVVVQRGTHESLKKEEGLYKELIQHEQGGLVS